MNESTWRVWNENAINRPINQIKLLARRGRGPNKKKKKKGGRSIRWIVGCYRFRAQIKIVRRSGIDGRRNVSHVGVPYRRNSREFGAFLRPLITTKLHIEWMNQTVLVFCSLGEIETLLSGSQKWKLQRCVGGRRVERHLALTFRPTFAV